MRTTLLIAASALCLLTGCMEYQITFANPEENYLTFNHPLPTVPSPLLKRRPRKCVRSANKVLS